MKKSLLACSGLLIAVAMVSIYIIGLHHGRTGEGLSIVKEVVAAQVKSSASPIKALKERDTYYPGTEALSSDEMRVTACGTGGYCTFGL